MHRIRTSLPYFERFGWEPEVVSIDTTQSEMVKDSLLLKSVPNHIKLHTVQAFSKKWTSKFKLGSLALRSLYFYDKKVSRILKSNSFDLIYFSTTQFPVTILGNYWKQKFGIPYVIDMQDPWHSDYYLNKPKNEQPAKFWFSYQLNKYLEPIALKKVDGLISVSMAYINTLKLRYFGLSKIPTSVITFGAFEEDFVIAKKNASHLTPAFIRLEKMTHLVYVGRGGNDMEKAIRLLFEAFKSGLQQDSENFNKLRIHFIGTSYAPFGKGKHTIYPIAKEYGLQNLVEEQTDRIPYYQGIQTLLHADALFIPGSDDPQYTASKIYPYILARKPLLVIFNPASSASDIIQKCNAGTVVNLLDSKNAIEEIYSFLLDLTNNPRKPKETNWDEFKSYSAENMTKRQCELFDKVISNQATV